MAGRLVYLEISNLHVRHTIIWSLAGGVMSITPNDEVDPGLAGDDLMSPDRT